MSLGLCILGAQAITIAATSFTLGWTHSAQKTEWLETWQVEPQGLQVVEARIKGSGAGMDPPEDAVRADGWWVYRPRLGPQSRIVLAASGATGQGWQLCAAGRCRELGAGPGAEIVIESCSLEHDPGKREPALQD